jgi:hypothetical protein
MTYLDNIGADSWEAWRKRLSLCLTGLTGQAYVVARAKETSEKFWPWSKKNPVGTFTLEGETLYLPRPETLGLNGQGFAALKIMGLFAWKWQSYTQGLSPDFFPYPRPLYRDLYFLLKGAQIEKELQEEFRGIEADLKTLRAISLEKRPTFSGLSPKEKLLEALVLHSLGKEVKDSYYIFLEEELYKRYQDILSSPWSLNDEVFLSLLKTFARIPGRYRGLPLVYHRGGFLYQKTNGHKPIFLSSPPERVESQKGNFSPAKGWFKAAKENKLEAFPSEGNASFLITRFVKLKFLESFLGFFRPAQELEGNLNQSLKKVEEQTLAPSNSPLSRALRTLAPEDEKIDPTPVVIADAVPYPEWDYRQQGYRRDWCWLQEKVMRGADPSWVDRVQQKNRALFLQLRRQFEALRPLPQTLKAQWQGEELDLDAYVESYADQKAQSYYQEAVYQERKRKNREVAAAFLVDISASTATPVKSGRIIDLEKEALVALTYALEILGDQYALYAFSGRTRKRCDFYPLKNFGEPFSPEIKRRLASLEPQDYTRMGVALRHTLKALEGVEAKVKILFVLSDAKPNDFDYYEGPYGLEDTRKALLEAREKCIQPFGLVIQDKENGDHKRLFGARNYVIINRVEDLPRKLPELYRYLTT